MPDSAAEIAALKATVEAQSREIRDLKQAHREQFRHQVKAVSDLADKVDELSRAIQPILKSATRLEALLIEADRQDGMRSLAKLIAGTSLLAMLSAAVLGIFAYFSKGPTP